MRDPNRPEDIALHAVKFDGEKPRMELLPGPPLYEIAQVLTYGATKYDEHNWRKGFRWTRPVGACLRHIFAWLGGEDDDPESGYSHLAHAACCLLFVMDHQYYKLGVDDRWVDKRKDTAA